MLDNIPTPDPADDRDVFERRLKNLICWKNEYTIEESIEALLAADAVKIADINAARQRCNTEVNNYLTEWDNAANRSQREQICGQPKSNKPNRELNL